MTIGTLNEILDKIHTVHAGLIGDFCLDIYWLADMSKSELSKETPHFPLPIVQERMAPGAAGNVAANMAALSPASLTCIGVRGKDWRGALLETALQEKGVHASLLLSPDQWTYAYCKPLRKGISDAVYEDPRLDFAPLSPLDDTVEATIMQKLDNLSSSLDILAVSDQFENGIITKPIREKLNALAEDGLKIIVDSRYHINQYRNVFLKPNESECAASVHLNTIATPEENARELAQQCHATVIETLGAKGALITDGSYAKSVPAFAVKGETDICGAGDTFLAAMALAVGAGFNLLVCAEFAALASAVTIQKIGQTGTAAGEEMIALFCENF